MNQSVLRWTRELPKVDGWFWYRSPECKPMVEGICCYNGVLGSFAPDDEFYPVSNSVPGEWAGPIQQPAE